MKRRCSILGVYAALCCLAACSRPTVPADYSVIPLPQEIVLKEGKPFVIHESVKIIYPEGNQSLENNAGFLAGFIKEATGLSLRITDVSDAEKGIYLELNDNIVEPEGYRILIDRENIHIQGKTGAGVFYGIQTLRKSMPINIKAGYNVALPGVQITDYPRFVYRGTLLDVGRHYFSVEYLKQFIDLLALHNINTFHWHLTEDQGWRIEIKKYPKLTEIGSKRKETLVNWEPKQMDGRPYGGFYTQDEVREIVAYAAERYITVIPEIDMPGHMLAALASYPELGCTGGPYEVSGTWGVFPDVLCAGNEKSLEFVKDVLLEVMELFPSSYIHIGGDECPKDRWQECKKCQAMIRRQGIHPKTGHTLENQLQTWFMGQVEQFIDEHGRRMIGWDEVLEGGLTPDATIMSWRGVQGGIKAAEQQHDVIMTPYLALYFSNPHILKLQGLETVKRVYDFEPVPQALDTANRHYIIGAQASIWTEWIKDSSRLEYVTLPRMAAASEIFWTQLEKKNEADFMSRLPRMLDRYAQQGYEFRKDIYDPYIQVKKISADSAEICCETFDHAPVYYTLNDEEPGVNASRYTDSFRVAKGTVVKAVAIRGEKASGVNRVEF